MKKKVSNFSAATYIAEKHGLDFTDEQIKNIAIGMGMKPKVLIENYKSVCDIIKIINSLKD